MQQQQQPPHHPGNNDSDAGPKSSSGSDQDLVTGPTFELEQTPPTLTPIKQEPSRPSSKPPSTPKSGKVALTMNIDGPSYRIDEITSDLRDMLTGKTTYWEIPPSLKIVSLEDATVEEKKWMGKGKDVKREMRVAGGLIVGRGGTGPGMFLPKS